MAGETLRCSTSTQPECAEGLASYTDILQGCHIVGDQEDRVRRSHIGRRTAAVPQYDQTMKVTFRKLVEKRVSTWKAMRGKRTRVPGVTMALGRGDMPHDLIQLVVEGAVRLDHGFWGSMAEGATFKSTGRKRTKPGREVIARNRDDLVQAEVIVGEHYTRWKKGRPTPAAAHFDDISPRWEALEDGGELVIEWPSLRVLARSPSGR